MEGKWVSIRCVHGDTVWYPLADVKLVVEGIPVTVEAAVADSLPVEVILGTDASRMTELLGRRVLCSRTCYGGDNKGEETTGNTG